MTTDANIVIGIKGDVSGGRRVKGALNDIERSSRGATTANQKLSKQMELTDKAAMRLKNTFGALIGTYAGIQGVRALLRVSDTYTIIENKLKLVTDGTEDLARVQAELVRVSDKTFTSLSSNATLFNRLTISTKELGASQLDVLRATEALQQTFRVSGATAQEASNSTIQFAQGLASGALRGDEFRSVSENNIRLQKLLAEGLGVTTGRLKEMADAGMLTAERIFPILADSLEQLNEEAENIAPTFEQAFAKVTEKLGMGIDEALRAEGEFQNLAEVIVGFSQPAEEFGHSIGSMINNLVNLQKTLGETGAGYASFLARIHGVDTSKFEDQGFTPLQFPNDLDQAPSFEQGDAPRSAADVFAGGVTRPKKKPSIPDSFFAGQADKASKALKIANDNRTKELKKLADEAKRAEDAINSVTDSLNFEIQQLQRNNVEQEISNNLRMAGVTLDSDAGQKIADLTREYERNSEALENQIALGEELGNAFDDFFTTAIQGTEGFDGAVRGLVGALADMAFQMTVIEPMKNSLFGGGGLFGTLLSSAFGAVMPAGASAAAARGASNPALFGPGFDNGGSIVLGGNAGIDQNQLSLNGLPIARTGRGETLSISPNQKNGGNGVVVNQTINISTGVQETVRAEIIQLLPEIQKSTKAAVQEDQLRGIS